MTDQLLPLSDASVAIHQRLEEVAQFLDREGFQDWATEFRQDVGALLALLDQARVLGARQAAAREPFYVGSRGATPGGVEMSKPDYDTSLARMAGNIAAGFVGRGACNPTDGDGTVRADDVVNRIATWSVKIARAIIAEVKNTDPARATEPSSPSAPREPHA